MPLMLDDQSGWATIWRQPCIVSGPANPPSNPPNIPQPTPNPGQPPAPAPSPDNPGGCTGFCNWTWDSATARYVDGTSNCSADCDCDKATSAHVKPTEYTEAVVSSPCAGKTQEGTLSDPSDPGRGEPSPEEGEGEGCNGHCTFTWRWARLPAYLGGPASLGAGGYWETGSCPGSSTPGGGVVNCICDPNHQVSILATTWPESRYPGFRNLDTVTVPCVDAGNQRVSTNFASSYSNIMDFVDNIWNEYNQVRSASLVTYTPMSWQGEIGEDDNLEGMQNIIFDGLELKQVQDANNNSPMYTYSSVDGRASSGPVAHNVTVAKVDGASERTRLVTINLVDRASRMADGSSNPELRDGEPGCSSRRAIYTWSGSEYALAEDCGGVGCQSGSVPTSYTEEKVYVACKDKKISSGVEGWPVKTISSVPPTAVQQLNNPAIAVSGHPVKVMGPDGWAMASGNSPIEAGAAATWPKKFSEIVPRGLKTTVVASGDMHPARESTPLFHRVPTPSGQLSIDPSGNIIRVHPDTYKGAIQRGQLSITPSSGVLSGFITHPGATTTSSTSTSGSTSSTSSSTGSTSSSSSSSSSDSGY
jgi:hypothetical protein